MELSFIDEIKIRGMKDEREEVFQPDKKIKEFLLALKNTQLYDEHHKIHLMKFESAYFDCKYFLESYFELHNVPTPVLNGKRNSISKIEYINPLELPIFIQKDQSIYSGALYEILRKEEPQILFRGIVLNNETVETTSAVYTHEIIHTQLNSIKGSIEHYKHMELISMLVGTIHSYDIDESERMLRAYDTYRIYEMLDAILEIYKEKNSFNPMKITTYLISNLKAYNIFMFYYYGNNKIKKEILIWIQKTLDGIKTVENFLQHFDSLEDSSYDDVKLLKYFSREKVQEI